MTWICQVPVSGVWTSTCSTLLISSQPSPFVSQVVFPAPHDGPGYWLDQPAGL